MFILNYKLLTFFPPYDKAAFYKLMGKFFAERTFKNILPYLVNSPATFWYVVVDTNNVVQAFSSFEKKKGVIELGDFYESGKENTIRKIILKKMLRDIKKEHYSVKEIRAAANSSDEKLLLESNGFELYKRTKNYYFLKKGNDYL